ncbi:MAG: hypothetical protein JSS20_18725, partial [Proteobacteria bacterium]|nr:hypothetical protein [Pseudomonadota bacterium]
SIPAEVAFLIDAGATDEARAFVRDALVALKEIDAPLFVVVDLSAESQARHAELLTRLGWASDSIAPELHRYTDTVRRRSTYALAHRLDGTSPRSSWSTRLRAGAIAGFDTAFRMHLEGFDDTPAQLPGGARDLARARMVERANAKE